MRIRAAVDYLPGIVLVDPTAAGVLAQREGYVPAVGSVPVWLFEERGIEHAVEPRVRGGGLDLNLGHTVQVVAGIAELAGRRAGRRAGGRCDIVVIALAVVGCVDVAGQLGDGCGFLIRKLHPHELASHLNLLGATRGENETKHYDRESDYACHGGLPPMAEPSLPTHN